MYVYELKKGMIESYRLIPDMKKVREYRETELSEFILKGKFWRAKCSRDERIFGRKTVVSIRELNKSDSGLYGGNFFHQFSEYVPDKKEFDETIEKLLTCLSNTHCVVTDFIDGRKTDVKYLSLGQSSEETDYHSSCISTKGIIEITKSVMLLDQLLMYKAVEDFRDISSISKEHLQLFKIEESEQPAVSIKQLKTACESKLINESFDSILYRIENSKKLLQRLKKLGLM